MTNKEGGMDNKDVKVLVRLLEDPDDLVFRKVGENLISQGENLIPLLEQYWEVNTSELIQSRLGDIIQKIQFNSLKREFSEWIRSKEKSVLRGAFLVAKYQFPDLNFSTIEEKIENIRHDVWLELNQNLTALEKVKILNHIIYKINKFTNNSLNLWSPQNSLINQVFESGKGSPLSLGILYSEVALRLNIPIYGVLLPKNFLLAYIDPVIAFDDTLPELSDSVLFYINPYNRGNVLGKKEIDYFLEQQDVEPKAFYYLPCKNSEIIAALINDLIMAYEKLGFVEKIDELKQLLDKISDS